MNLLRLEAQIDGVTYVAECPAPDLNNVWGKQSVYSAIYPKLKNLSWNLASDIANKVETPCHWAEVVGGK